MILVITTRVHAISRKGRTERSRWFGFRVGTTNYDNTGTR